MEIVFVWLLLAIGVGAIAASRGRSGFGFFLLSAVLSPLIGLAVVLVLDDLNKKKAQEEAAAREHERRIEEVKAISGAAQQRASTTGSVASIADELEKLGALRDKGLLDEQEFQQQKAALLGTRAQGGVPAPTAADPPAVPMGRCSHCNALIPMSSESCPECKALFGTGSAFTIRPLAN